jgi:hypothetical protein
LGAAVANEQSSLFSEAYVEKARSVFCRAHSDFGWEAVVICAVGQNTFRGFRKINKQCPGAKKEFIEYFQSKKNDLIDAFTSMQSASELHEVCNRICEEIQNRLGNILPLQLTSYNKVRKPVDLYIEHLVAMARELNGLRSKLIPLLYLPLDSQILAHPALYSDKELACRGLSRRSTYQDVRSEKVYLELQELLAEKAASITESCGQNCERIYFDMLWNDRFLKPSETLFTILPKSNPARSHGDY